MSGPSRRRMVVGLVSLVLLSFVALGCGLGLVLLGEGRWRATGWALLAMVAATAWVVWGPRAPQALVRTTTWRGRPALLLPPRAGHVAAVCAATLTFAVASLLLGAGMIEAGETGSGRRSPLSAVAAGVVLLGYGAWMTVRAALGGGRVLVTGDGLVTTGLVYRTVLVPWRDINEIALQPGVVRASEIRLSPRALRERRGRRHLVPSSPRLAVPLTRVAWRDGQTASTLRWLLKHRTGKAVHRGLADGPSPAAHQALADDVTAFARSLLPPARIRP